MFIRNTTNKKLFSFRLSFVFFSFIFLFVLSLFSTNPLDFRNRSVFIVQNLQIDHWKKYAVEMKIRTKTQLPIVSDLSFYSHLDAFSTKYFASSLLLRRFSFHFFFFFLKPYSPHAFQLVHHSEANSSTKTERRKKNPKVRSTSS